MKNFGMSLELTKSEKKEKLFNLRPNKLLAPP